MDAARENVEAVKQAIARCNARDLSLDLDNFNKSVERKLRRVGRLASEGLRGRFPDMRISSEDPIAEGKKIASRPTFFSLPKASERLLNPICCEFLRRFSRHDHPTVWSPRTNGTYDG
jgi:hypothetical protein